MSPTVDSVWSAQDTSPGAVEAALRDLLKERHADQNDAMPARALNLVCVVDSAWSGEIANRLSRVGRYHASRTVVCSVEPGRSGIDARVMLHGEGESRGDSVPLVRETVVLSVGERHLRALDSIVDPLVVTDVATVVWAPHGHVDALDALLSLAQVVLLDSVEEPDTRTALDHVCRLADRAYVVDLAWLRGTPWRERVAAAFDPPARRAGLRTLAGVTVRHRTDSGVAALLLAGWLASRLGWRPEGLVHRGDVWRGRARTGRGEVDLVLEPVERMSVPGLAGIELRDASGASLSLERGTGGLTARRVDRRGAERIWTVVGASRGEPGILGEGLRQALLRDPTFPGALDAARVMAT